MSGPWLEGAEKTKAMPDPGSRRGMSARTKWKHRESGLRPWLYGASYRVSMKVAHRLGFCYPQRTFVAENSYWCHWCGLRGRK